MKAQIPWLRVFVEGVVIVGSILLALGLDTWRDERVERVAARDELQQVAVDLAENARLLEYLVRQEDRIARAVAELQVQVSAAENGDVVSVPDTFVTAFLYHPDYDPVVASIERLLSSGRLPFVGNLQLQTALSRWPRELEDLLGNTALQDQGVTEHILVENWFTELRQRMGN